jgi:hypothetical protein
MFFAVSGHSPLSPDGRTGGLKQNASFEGNRMPIKDIRKILDCKFKKLGNPACSGTSLSLPELGLREMFGQRIHRFRFRSTNANGRVNHGARARQLNEATQQREKSTGIKNKGELWIRPASIAKLIPIVEKKINDSWTFLASCGSNLPAPTDRQNHSLIPNPAKPEPIRNSLKIPPTPLF